MNNKRMEKFMKKIFTIMLTFMAVSSIAFAQDAKKYIADLNPANDEKTITTAADWLGDKKEKDAVNRLVALLTDKRDGVRLHAVQALGYIGEKSSAGSLHNVLLNDKNSTVRYAAILSTMRIKDDKSENVLRQALQNEQAKGKDSDPFILDLLTKLKAKEKK